MAKVLIIYYSRGGNTEKMAAFVEEGVRGRGVEVETKRVEDVQLEELLQAEGIIIGSPTYYGTMAAEIKRLLDESVKYHGKLEGKVGGAFSSSGGIGGGNETTVLDILKSLLVHGIVVQGTSQGDHYGPVAVGAPDERSAKNCRRLGERVAELVKKLH
ncbi:MAG: flavodoxin [Planctomycetes bacterium DG_23]|nr:MAG: flavodoxin [Planctomycetes bacterium DG_23]